MDIGKSFTFIFDEEDWLKHLAIGGIIAIIPILNFAAFGYIAQLIKNVRDGHEHPLPEWGENLGQFFVDGLKIFVALLVYYSPLILLSCIFGGVIIALSETVNSSEVEGVIAVSSICFNCGIFLFAFLPYIFFPGIFVRFAETGEISAMLQIREIMAFIRQDTTNYIVVLLLSGAVLYFIAPFGLVLCLIGVIFTQWWAYLVFGHLTGQLWGNNAELV